MSHWRCFPTISPSGRLHILGGVASTCPRAPRKDLREGGSANGSNAARFLHRAEDRIPIRDLEEYFPGVLREDLCAGMRIGVQRAVFFLGLRRADLERWWASGRQPRVGRGGSRCFWPGPVAVRQSFHHAFLVEDMTTLLAAARLQPIPLRRGDERRSPGSWKRRAPCCSPSLIGWKG